LAHGPAPRRPSFQVDPFGPAGKRRAPHRFGRTKKPAPLPAIGPPARGEAKPWDREPVEVEVRRHLLSDFRDQSLHGRQTAAARPANLGFRRGETCLRIPRPPSFEVTDSPEGPGRWFGKRVAADIPTSPTTPFPGRFRGWIWACARRFFFLQQGMRTRRKPGMPCSHHPGEDRVPTGNPRLIVRLTQEQNVLDPGEKTENGPHPPPHPFFIAIRAEVESIRHDEARCCFCSSGPARHSDLRGQTRRPTPAAFPASSLCGERLRGPRFYTISGTTERPSYCVFAFFAHNVRAWFSSSCLMIPPRDGRPPVLGLHNHRQDLVKSRPNHGKLGVRGRQGFQQRKSRFVAAVEPVEPQGPMATPTRRKKGISGHRNAHSFLDRRRATELREVFVGTSCF